MILAEEKIDQLEQTTTRAFPRRFELARQSLLLLCALLPPWLFGTTENWAIVLMNVLCDLAGIFLVLRFAFFRRPALRIPTTEGARWVTATVASLSGLILAYCLISALNARATFLPAEHRFEYHKAFKWLPLSYDQTRTWFVLWTYASLACFFWCLRDWITSDPGLEREAKPWDLSPRLRLLLWAISVNATVLALVGVFERLTNTSKLLWLAESYDRTPENMFGTFSFRGNAAQYFNLAWPLMLAAWWTFRQRAGNALTSGFKIGSKPHFVLLPCTILVAAAPIISGSRGGALIDLFCLCFAFLILFSRPFLNWTSRCSLLLLVAAILWMGTYLSSEALTPFMQRTFSTKYGNPAEISENAQKMAADFPLFGVGPGAFSALYQLYKAPDQTWQTYAHDDWLEMRVAFGLVGSMIILCMLALVLARWFVPPGIPSTYEFVALIWVAIGGCLANAKFSFPLQIFSILQLFLVLCCILICISRPLPKWAE